MSLVNAGTFEGLIRSLDSDPLRRGKQFEKITKWWLQNDPIHSRDVKKVWLWDEWPDRPGRDIGVDLVAEMRDGSLCAIQSKCFDMGRDIPKSELDSFVSAASTRTFKHRWLVASTDGLSANARRMLRDNHVTQILFSYLDSLEGFWPASFDALGGTPTIVKASPRPHQQDAIRDVVEGLSKVSCGQLIMACGTGKTLTALWITEALEPSTTLVLVPSLSLLSQTLSEWAKNANTKWDYLCVCSDETVNKSDDSPISTTEELPFDVTTKPADIAAFLERRGRKIIFSTYQSSAQVAKAQKTAGKKFDLVICDEAHRLTGKNDAEFATALDDTKIPAKKRLFMTATPRTFTANVKAMASERGVEITSMDDETVFGRELHKLSFGQAIEKELLTDYRVVIVGVTDPQVQELIDQRELVSVAGTVETDARTLAAHIGLAKATKDYDLKRTISFHGRIKTAQQFAQQHATIVEWMPDDQKPSGTIWADTITGAMSSSERRKLLNKLKADVPGQHALLSNARCLTEGVDVPSLDGVAFIDPRSSQVDIIQAVGRAIRKSDDKALGTIILPVLIPHDADTEHSLDDSAFKPIWAILNALRSHDESFAQSLDQIRTDCGRNIPPNSSPEKIIIDLPFELENGVNAFSSSLQLKIVENCSNSWFEELGNLISYAEQQGHIRVPQKFRQGEHRLDMWLSRQRTLYKSGELHSDRIKTLENFHNLNTRSVEWSWVPSEYSWETGIASLQKFVDKEGHARVPYLHMEGDFNLYQWVINARNKYKTGQISGNKIEQLENMPGWSWSPHETQWQKVFSEYQSLISNPDQIQVIPQQLKSWINNQRVRYRNGDLEDHKVDLLEATPGWVWEKTDDSWQNAFELLRRYLQLNQMAYPASGTKFEGFDIAGWTSNQRLKFSRNQLSHDQQNQLESLPGWSFNPSHVKIEGKIDALERFCIREKTSEIPDDTIEAGVRLDVFAKWIRLGKHKLTSKQIERLERVPYWSWDPVADLWDDFIHSLLQYIDREQNTKVPRDHIEGTFPLGKWCRRIRLLKNQNTLELEFIRQLDHVPEWKWSIRESSAIGSTNKLYADKAFPLIEEFCTINGHSIVPIGYTVDGMRLDTWVNGVRNRYRRSVLAESTIQRLEGIQEWAWDTAQHEWSKAVTLVSNFAAEFKHTGLPRDLIVDGFEIGKWCRHIRIKKGKGELSEDQIESLESIPSWKWHYTVNEQKQHRKSYQSRTK